MLPRTEHGSRNTSASVMSTREGWSIIKTSSENVAAHLKFTPASSEHTGVQYRIGCRTHLQINRGDGFAAARA